MKERVASLSIFFMLYICCSICLAGERKMDEAMSMAIDKLLFIARGAQDRLFKIGLLDCLAYALKGNSEILIKHIEPKIKEGDIRIQRADFKPTFTVDYTLQANTKEATSTLGYANLTSTRDIDLNASISGKLITGTQYDIDFLTQRYANNASTQRINPYYTTEPKITLTQPLFRNSGVIVNKANIIIAQNDKHKSAEGFKETVMDVITRTKTAYYNYLYYLENYSINASSLKRAKDLLKINKARYEKGLVSSVDLLETETAVAQREKALISAESYLKKSEDDLKLITNLVEDPEAWNAKIELVDRKPEFRIEKINLLDSLQNAFKYRPDYNSSKIDLKNRDIKIITAENALYPTVDLSGSFGLNGLDRDYQDALASLKSDYKDWSIGLKVSVPWGTGERARLDQRKLELAQALIAFKRLEQDIILEVRDKVRLVDIQKRQVMASRLSREKETQNYEAQKHRYAAGQASTHDILDYQDKLAEAELDYIKGLIDYNIALINLDKSEGLTLIKNDIIILED